ncbi:hypothetical protein H2204_010829 [Knufia peltigerae]|uniref:Zn(2)-C6 fungal-type domain-containing protein n=1 Tax=Knufia peltigerae TaxID=1002370 RepID=A0AA39CTU0_9EURO|nr:hypothetical protein H2204_010829 [Knufia peltigerae]
MDRGEAAMVAVASSKRRYMSKSQRACDFCRSRKVACRIDAALPCKLCRSYNRLCTFDEPAKPRKKTPATSQPGDAPSAAGVACDAVSSLQHDFGAREDTTMPLDLDNFDDSIDIFAQLDAFTPQEDPFATTAVMAGLDRWPTPFRIDAADNENTRSTAAMTVGTSMSSPSESEKTSIPANAASQLCGLTGDMDPSNLCQYRYDSHNVYYFKRLAIHSVFDGIHPISFVVSLDRSSPKVEDKERAELNRIVDPQIGIRFYQFIFPQFPILRTTSKPTPTESPPHLLAAIYLLAQRFSGFDDYLCIQIVYETFPSKQLAGMATAALHRDSNEPTLAHVQTALLILLAPPENLLMPETAARWALHGTLVAMAQGLGLFHDPSEWTLSHEEIILRRILSWAVRCVDAWLAAALGRIPLIDESNWMVPPPHAADFEESELALGVCEVFIPLVQLSQILTSVLANLFSLRAVQALAVDFRLTLRTAHPLMDQVTRWYQDYQQVHLPTSMHDVDSSGILHLGYHAIKIMILRAIYRPFQNLERGHIAHSTDTVAEKEAFLRWRTAASRALAASTAFTSALDHTRVHAFWPFWSALSWSTIGQLAVLLLVISESEGEALQSKAALDITRQSLRLQSKSFDILRFPLLRLDSFHWKGFGSIFNLPPAVESALQLSTSLH